VAIVEDHPLWSEGLAGRLRDAGFTIVTTVAAVEQLDCQADVVVCDLRLPGRSGADAIGHLTERGCRVLATSGVATRETILDVIASGARGFVSKASPPQMFVRAVRDVAAGGFFISAELASHLRADAELRPMRYGDIGRIEREVLRCFERGDISSEVAASLGLSTELLDAVLAKVWDAAAQRRKLMMPTPREREVMRLVAEGLSHKEVATRMAIASVTVAGYLTTIKEKYLATHPGEPEDTTPLTSARKWAQELGLA
jgi:DNA-binding NarL/FixJ family response regulator